MVDTTSLTTASYLVKTLMLKRWSSDENLKR